MSKLFLAEGSRTSSSSRAENQAVTTPVMPSTRKRPLEQVDTQNANLLSLDKSGYFAELITKSLEAAASTSGGWAPELLMCLLNEMSSPYGDVEQRLAAAFLQALFAKLTRTGSHYYHSICTAAARTQSFESQKKMVLKFQELSPGEKKVHILDVSNNFCTQWPTLFEALAMRAEHPPQRLEKFARLMGVPFEFRVLQPASIETLEPSMLDIREGEALIVNCFQSLQQTPESDSDRDHLLALVNSIQPKVVIVVEDEVNLASNHFMTCFLEVLRFYSMFFDALDNGFPRTSNERLMLERVAARKIVAVLACDDTKQRFGQWKVRMQKAGFATKPLRDEIVDDIQALLKRYKPGWALCRGGVGLFLTWKDQNAISVSVWKHSCQPA